MTHTHSDSGSRSPRDLAMPPFVGAARADAASALRCQQTINKELAKFVKTKSTILKSCKEGAVKRAIPRARSIAR